MNKEFFKTNNITKLFILLNELEDKNLLKIRKKIRFKHFQEDLAIISHLFDMGNRNEKVMKWVWEDFYKILDKRIGVKIIK